jgi:predicted lipoprotein with Yx(FWY)xxD motif
MVIVGTAGSDLAVAAAPTVLVADTTAFGPVLTTSSGLALYTLDTDHDGQSTCHGSCAAAWPPLNVPSGTAPTGGPGVTGTVGSSPQSNGTFQVTYNGAPVYTFVGDTAPGEVTGNNVSGFFVVKVTAVASTTTTTPATTVPGATAPSGSSAPSDNAPPAGATPTAPGSGTAPEPSATASGSHPGTAAAGALAFTGSGPGLVLLSLAGLLLVVLGGLALARSSARRRSATGH